MNAQTRFLRPALYLAVFVATAFIATRVIRPYMLEWRLLRAISNHDVAAVKNLLFEGADPNTAHVGRYSALIGAAYNGDDDTLRLLLHAGGNPNGEMIADATPLGAAVRNNRLSTVNILLVAGADPTLPFGEGVTPIQRAANNPAYERQADGNAILELLQQYAASRSVAKVVH